MAAVVAIVLALALFRVGCTGPCMAEFHQYIEAIFGTWFVYIGLFFAIEQVAERLMGQSLVGYLDRFYDQDKRRQLTQAAALLFVFYAGFVAWREEHDRPDASAVELADTKTEFSDLQRRYDRLEKATPPETIATRKEFEAQTAALRALEAKYNALETRYASRDLQPKHAEELLSYLRNKGAGIKIDFLAQDGDGDAIRLCAQLAAVFHAAGFETEVFTHAMFSMPMFGMGLRSSPENGDLARGIVDTMREGFAMGIGLDSTQPKDHLSLIVGFREH